MSTRSGTVVLLDEVHTIPVIGGRFCCSSQTLNKAQEVSLAKMKEDAKGI